MTHFTVGGGRVGGVGVGAPHVLSLSPSGKVWVEHVCCATLPGFVCLSPYE